MKNKPRKIYRRAISGIRPRESRRGVALITVLSILAVVTVLIVGFTIMARMDREASGSYSGGVRAEQIAQAGLESIVYDFRKEIAAGSYDNETNRKSGFSKYYEPYRDTNDVALSILPRKIGYPPTLKTALRRSVGYARSDDYYTNFPKLGSSSNGFLYYVTNRDVQLPTPINYIVETTDPSKNSRSVSAERWNKPRFVNFNETDQKKAFTDNPPCWVYISREGIVTSATNTTGMMDNRSDSYVIGRFAYVVYDVSGLVDITVTGHATNQVLNNSMTNATNDSNNVSWTKKGLLQAADLTLLRIKGSSGDRAIDSAQLNRLLTWRDTNVINTASNYSQYLFGATNYSTTNTNFIAVTNNGYMKSGFTKTYGSNNTFISRQDLIAYCSTNSSLKDFLPMFSTFSREKNAPSWGPRTTATTNAALRYGTNPNSYTTYTTNNGYLSAETAAFPGYPNSVVTNVAGVRYTETPKSFTTVTPDGCVLVYTNQNRSNNRLIYTNAELPVRAGSPVLRKRFPLSRIAWLTLTNNDIKFGPRSEFTNAIRQAFGLVWSDGNIGEDSKWANRTNEEAFGMAHWIYTSPDTNVGATNRIKTLVELTNTSIVKNARDPDFFETLKATIMDGSLGVVEAYSLSNTMLGVTNMVPIQVDMYAINKNPDFQILRIGANIIDQADEDSFATAITFKNSINAQVGGPVSTATTTNETIYGIESLPYMSHLFGFNGGLNKGSLNPEHPNEGLWATWITPGVWDPHQNASRPSSFSTDSNANNASASLPASNSFRSNVPMYFRVYAAGRATTWVNWAPLKYSVNSLPSAGYETNTNPGGTYYTVTQGTNVYKYTNFYHPIRTPIFDSALGYKKFGSNTWNPTNDMVYFDRNPTNLFYILNQKTSTPSDVGVGRMNSYGVGESDANGFDTNNRCAFDEPIMLMRAYANTRPMRNNGASSNGTNANYYTNVRHLNYNYYYYISLSTPDASYTRLYGNCFYGTNGDGQMHGFIGTSGSGTSVQSLKETNHWSWMTFDYRPGVVGFNTGITKPRTARAGNTADFGRHYVLASSTIPSDIAADTNTGYNKDSYKYRLLTNYGSKLNADADSGVSQYGGDPLDGKMMDVFGATEGVNASDINSSSFYGTYYPYLPTFVFQASTNPELGPWRTYEVVSKIAGAWGGYSNSGGYYTGQNYAKANGGSINLYEPPDDGMQPWANTGSIIPDPRTLRLGVSHPYQGTDPFHTSADNMITWTMTPNATNMNDVVASSYQINWEHSGEYVVGKGFYSVDYSNKVTTYDKWVTGSVFSNSPLTNTNFSAFFYMINAEDVTNSTGHKFRFNTKIHTSGTTTWSWGGSGFYLYADRDNIIRPGDAYLGVYSGKTNQILINPMEVGDIYVGRSRQIQDRPIVLNRAFRTVGELGYVFRDMPWKSLDFFTTNSADAGLLDAFTSYEYNTDYSAGKINLNTPYPSILATLMAGAIQNEVAWEFVMTESSSTAGPATYGIRGRSSQRYPDKSALLMKNYNNNGDNRAEYKIHPTNALTNVVISSNSAYMMASNIVYNSGATNDNVISTPFMNISQFVTRNSTNPNYPTPSSVNTNASGTYDTNPNNVSMPSSIFFLPIIKTQREAYIRSLAETTQTRTWNFMIDIIAQTGRFVGGGSGALEQFTVEGERRYWLHIAIDRYTGEVIDQRLEPVNE